MPYPGETFDGGRCHVVLFWADHMKPELSSHPGAPSRTRLWGPRGGRPTWQGGLVHGTDDQDEVVEAVGVFEFDPAAGRQASLHLLDLEAGVSQYSALSKRKLKFAVWFNLRASFTNSLSLINAFSDIGGVILEQRSSLETVNACFLPKNYCFAKILWLINTTHRMVWCNMALWAIVARSNVRYY